MSPPPLLSARGLRRSYGPLEVLHGVDLDVAHGEFLAVVGPSGAGKSTLLALLGALERPDAGSVTFSGPAGGSDAPLDVTALTPDKAARWRCRNVGFVFQAHRLLPEFTLQENIALPAMIAGEPRRQALERAAALAASLGLAGRLRHRPGQLSGGEAQRGAVARALVNDPAVVLADEPSGSLDSQARARLYDLLLGLRQDTAQTFVIVTHDDSLAARADRTLLLRDGRIVA